MIELKLYYRWCLKSVPFAMLLVLSCTTTTSLSNVFGVYANISQQIERSPNIAVIKIIAPTPGPPAPSKAVYDPTIKLDRDSYTIKILGILKGHLNEGSTITAHMYRYGLGHSNPVPGIPETAIVQFTWEHLPSASTYLVFMDPIVPNPAGKSSISAINRELNILHVTGKGPYHLKKDEIIAQAIARLTGVTE